MQQEYPMDDLISITGGPLRAHEYVLVTPYLTAADEAWIQNHSARMSGDARDKKNRDLILTIGDVQLATLKRSIRGWSLTRMRPRTDGTGTEEVPIPFSSAAIEQLPRHIYRYLLKKVNELNPDESDEGGESDEDFLPAVVDSSEESFSAERILRKRR